MGYISGFGTGFVAPTLGLAALLSAGLASASAAGSADVTVNVSNLRNTKGQLMICLTKNPKAFPDCSKDSSALRRLVSASSSSVTFANVSDGTYAIAVVHDENRNSKLDTTLMMPKEGFGFSRNPAIRMGPPKFKSASFAVSGSDVTQNLKMKYIF